MIEIATEGKESLLWNVRDYLIREFADEMLGREVRAKIDD